MQTWKLVLLTGVATLAMTGCSGAEGPGAIGSRDDIMVRNAGDDRAPPPPELAREEITEAAMEEGEPMSEEVAGDAPSAAEMIAAPETNNAPVASVESEPVMEEMEEIRPPEAQGMAEAEAPIEIQTNRQEVAAPIAEKIVEQAPPEAVLEENAPMATTIMAQPEQAAAPQSTEPTPMPEELPVADVQQTTERVQPTPEAQPAAVPAPVEATSAPLSATDLMREVATLRNATPEQAMQVQKMMKEAGYYNGEINGEVDGALLNNYISYRTAANVPAAPSQAPAVTPAPAVQQVAPAPVPAVPAVSANGGATATIPASDNMPAREVAVPQLQVPSGSVQAVAPAPAASASAQVAGTPKTFTAANASMEDPALISAAQKALTEKGFYTGALTGKVDTATLNALSRYQAANQLTPGGLNMETLRSLGVVTQ